MKYATTVYVFTRSVHNKTNYFVTISYKNHNLHAIKWEDKRILALKYFVFPKAIIEDKIW